MSRGSVHWIHLRIGREGIFLSLEVERRPQGRIFLFHELVFELHEWSLAAAFWCQVGPVDYLGVFLCVSLCVPLKLAVLLQQTLRLEFLAKERLRRGRGGHVGLLSLADNRFTRPSELGFQTLACQCLLSFVEEVLM